MQKIFLPKAKEALLCKVGVQVIVLRIQSHVHFDVQVAVIMLETNGEIVTSFFLFFLFFSYVRDSILTNNVRS